MEVLMQIMLKNNISQNLASLKTDLKLIQIAKESNKNSAKPLDCKGNVADANSPKK
jgi:hypothetical protein